MNLATLVFPILAATLAGAPLGLPATAAGIMADLPGGGPGASAPEAPATRPESADPAPGDGDARAQAGPGETAGTRIQALRKAYQGPFILGSDLFDGTAPMRPGALASVSDDYRLGPGDTMTLYVFGSATFDLRLTVDRAGSIAIPRVGSAHVGGLRLGDARRAVQGLVDRVYAGSRAELQFASTRDVRVFILGEVYLGGSYVVPSLTSLLNALEYAGGPSPFGSYRAIQLIRAGRVVQTLDLYAFRLRGLGLDNLQLRDGDTLFVPMAGTQVLMDGAFARVAASPVQAGHPGVLVELAAAETAWDAFQYIGGLRPSAYPRLVTLERTASDGVVRVENLATDPRSLRAKTLFPGDRVRALVQAERREGVVEVTGYAKVPGQFEFRTGLRVTELLRSTDQLQPDTYLARGQVVRTLADGSTELLAFDLGRALAGEPAQDLALQPRDLVELYRTGDLRLPRTVKVIGPFTTPGVYPWHRNMRAADLVFRAGVPELRADRYYAELAHMSPAGEVSRVVRLDLARLLYTADGRAPITDDEAVNPALQPYDQITLYEIPGFQAHRTVTISGQVRRPGSYVITENHFTLRQLIDRAGGLTPEAMTRGGIFLRNNLREKDLSEADRNKAGVGATDPSGQGINEILQRLSETKRLKDTGKLVNDPVLHNLLNGSLNRLVVDFQSALTGDARQDVELLDGDRVIIPRQADSAYVVGEVASPFATYRVKAGDSVRFLVNLAGGFTRNADRSRVRLLKADGRILDHSIMGKTVEPGDAVLVPQRFRTISTWQQDLQALTPLALLINAIWR